MFRSEDSEEAEAATGSPGPESGGRFTDSGKDLETGTVDDARHGVSHEVNNATLCISRL